MRHPHPVHLASAVPGLRTSAAFLTSLSANLRLPDDDLYPSPMNTPPSMRATITHLPLPPQSPLSAAMSLSREASDAAAASGNKPAVARSGESEQPDGSKSPADDLPTLATYAPMAKEEKIEALKLVADSIAQQRQTASRAIIFHPLTLSVYVLVVAIYIQRFYKSSQDLLTVLMTLTSCTVACLVGVRYFTEGYIREAENINWEWVGDDQFIVTKWGDDIIGALVLGWAKDEGRGRRKKGGRGVIRAWTVKLRYRRKGVGTALLEEAVDSVVKRAGDGIEFAENHANSTRLLKPIFNGPFDRVETRALNTLQKVVDDKGAFSRRRQRTP